MLSKALKMQKEVIETARAAMLDAQQSANDNDDDTEEKLFNSYREEMQNKRDMFARQLEQAFDDLQMLQKVTVGQAHNEVEFGSVVETDSQKLFISISLGAINIEEGQYFAISPSAPLYKAMAGKKAGETFQFRDKDIKVKQVF